MRYLFLLDLGLPISFPPYLVGMWGTNEILPVKVLHNESGTVLIVIETQVS